MHPTRLAANPTRDAIASATWQRGGVGGDRARLRDRGGGDPFVGRNTTGVPIEFVRAPTARVVPNRDESAKPGGTRKEIHGKTTTHDSSGV